ncbi:uncharacterized protein LOC119727999 [Patiria miniata]|uniref:B box-type domain-containing protein n=1 Tax=Patiria miniata TaxID=46514 RepID=A0A913ZWH7_PATMI|nr:uncharacterized protein LOC119727999 [Patiria miniata]
MSDLLLSFQGSQDAGLSAQLLSEVSGRDDEQTEARAEKITCPVCRRETQVPDGGLQSLSSSFFLSSLVDEVKQQEAVLGDASAPTATCDCGEGKEVIWRCLDCSDNLCQECRKAHERVKSTKDHRIISLGDWHKSKIPPAEHSKPITRMCTIHHDHPLCFFCDTCDTLICSMCAALGHRSAEHNFLNIDDLIRSFRSEVENILQKFEKSRQHFKSTEKSIQHARNRLQKKLAQARSDIDAKAEAEITKIRNKAKLLTDKVNEIGQERVSKYEKALTHNHEQMERADQTIAAVNDLMSQADDFELLELKPKVMHNLEFQELKCEPANYGLSFIGVRFQDVVSDADLGEVCVSEKWQLKEEFGKRGTGDEEFDFATAVACFRNGDIVVTDTILKRLSLFSSTGQYKTSVAQGDAKHQLEAPFGAAMTHDDLLFVTDKKKVKVFDNELQFVREFTPSADDADGQSESYLTGVAVDSQRVAVADRGRKLISVHNLDGSLISSISNSMVDYYLAISNFGCLVFANFEGQSFFCVNFEGKEMFSVKTFVNGKAAKPAGVLCDDDETIYVVVHPGKREDSEVQRYDSNGALVATVAQGCSIR